MTRKAALSVPLRLKEDIVSGDARDLKLYLQNVKERFDDLHKTLETLTTSVDTVTNTVTEVTSTTTTTDFTPDYTSAEQTVATSTTYTLPHALGGIPKLVRVVLRNKTAELGYAVGDEVLCDSIFLDGANTRGVTIAANTTNIYIVIAGTLPQILHLTTQARTAITAANWKFVVTAWI